LSLKFLVDFYAAVIQPVDPKMTTKRVADDLFKPYTEARGGGSVMDVVMPNIYVPQLTAFISHANDNQFVLLVQSLTAYFKDAVWPEVFIYVDIFTIDQNNVIADLQDGETLKATIANSAAVLVVLDERAYPLTRLWCLYEIGSTPIEKLTLLTHGLDPTKIAAAYDQIDSSKADCWAQSDKDMIRRKVMAMMIEQKVVPQGVTIEEAMTAFTRVLKLLLILKPTSYAADMAALLKQAAGYESYPLKQTVEQACTGGRLICIAGGSGEGKSTLAAALVKTIDIDACHFCKLADVRRQDRGLIVRSLSYQLAIRHPAFAQALLAMSPSQVESLSDEATAFKLLLETPLRAARGLRATILVDALDESGGDGRMISLLVDIDNVWGRKGALAVSMSS